MSTLLKEADASENNFGKDILKNYKKCVKNLIETFHDRLPKNQAIDNIDMIKKTKEELQKIFDFQTFPKECGKIFSPKILKEYCLLDEQLQLLLKTYQNHLAIFGF